MLPEQVPKSFLQISGKNLCFLPIISLLYHLDSLCVYNNLLLMVVTYTEIQSVQYQMINISLACINFNKGQIFDLM